MAIRRTRIIVETDELILIRRKDSRIQQQTMEPEVTAPAAIHYLQKTGEKLGLAPPSPSRPEDFNNKNKKENKS